MQVSVGCSDPILEYLPLLSANSAAEGGFLHTTVLLIGFDEQRGVQRIIRLNLCQHGGQIAFSGQRS